jgi:hypothetical protein
MAKVNFVAGRVKKLPREKLEEIVTGIQYILWWDLHTEKWDADKPWNSEVLDDVARLLEEQGLKP